jgi:hypothetical protein
MPLHVKTSMKTTVKNKINFITLKLRALEEIISIYPTNLTRIG